MRIILGRKNQGKNRPNLWLFEGFANQADTGSKMNLRGHFSCEKGYLGGKSGRIFVDKTVVR
jgi:hypothetical protein